MERRMASLHRLVYGSTATGSTDSLLNVATILAQSQRNNVRDGLTGALAAHRGRFIQVVEGPPQALDRLLHRLASDPRHADIRVVDRTPVEQRSFADWSMVSARITPALAPLLDRIVDGAGVDPARTVAAMREAVALG